MLSRGTMRAERSSDPLDRPSRLSVLWCIAHQHFLADAQPGFRSPGIRVRHPSPQAAKSRMAACESPTIDCPAYRFLGCLEPPFGRPDVAVCCILLRTDALTMAGCIVFQTVAICHKPPKTWASSVPVDFPFSLSDEFGEPGSSGHSRVTTHSRQSLKDVDNRNATFEKHYRVNDLARIWGLGLIRLRHSSDLATGHGHTNGGHQQHGASRLDQ